MVPLVTGIAAEKELLTTPGPDSGDYLFSWLGGNSGVNIDSRAYPTDSDAVTITENPPGTRTYSLYNRAALIHICNSSNEFPQRSHLFLPWASEKPRFPN